MSSQDEVPCDAVGAIVILDYWWGEREVKKENGNGEDVPASILLKCILDIYKKREGSYPPGWSLWGLHQLEEGFRLDADCSTRKCIAGP